MEALFKGLFGGMLLVTMCFATPAWSRDNARNSRDIPVRNFDYDDRDTGMYFGGNIGVSRYELERDGFDTLAVTLMDGLGFPVDSGTSTVDNGSNAFSFVAGYRLSKYLAGEANFIDFGATDYRADLNVETGSDVGMATVTARLKTRALGFSLLGTLPLSRGFDLHARLGRLTAQTRLDAAANLPDGSGSKLTHTSDSNQILYGFGASNRIGERWMINVDYQVLKTSDSFTGDVRALMLGFQFRL